MCEQSKVINTDLKWTSKSTIATLDSEMHLDSSHEATGDIDDSIFWTNLVVEKDNKIFIFHLKN